MTTRSELDRAGDMIRHWRARRNFSQRELAKAARVSTRHLSFIETGRANASRSMLLRLARALRMNYRQVNLLMKLAGYAAAYPEPALEDTRMAPVWDAISQVLNQHEPYPAVLVRPNYDILWSNHGFQKVTAALAGDGILDRYPNLYRLLFARGGMQPYIQDWEHIREVLLARLYTEAHESQNDAVGDLFEELSAPYGPAAERVDPAGQVVFPLCVSRGDLQLRMFSTSTRFNTAASVTVQEMRIESFFPADADSRECYLQHFDRRR